MIDTRELQHSLITLGYDPGVVDGIFGPRTRSAVRALQSDLGLAADGICGPVTGRMLNEILAKVPHDGPACRRLRVTMYYCAAETDYPSSPEVPVYTVEDGAEKMLCHVSASFFAQMALEGTGILSDGTLLNVQGKTVPVMSDAYEPVLEYAKRDRFSHVEYAGIRLDPTRSRVVAAITFMRVPLSRTGVGYGLEHGLPKVPWKSCAGDPAIFDLGSTVYVAELAGLILPDGTMHDGDLVVNDTGSAIKGLHIDWFTGTKALYASGPKQPEYPRLCHAVAPCLNELPLSFTYGLTPT